MRPAKAAKVRVSSLLGCLAMVGPFGGGGPLTRRMAAGEGGEAVVEDLATGLRAYRPGYQKDALGYLVAVAAHRVRLQILQVRFAPV